MLNTDLKGLAQATVLRQDNGEAHDFGIMLNAVHPATPIESLPAESLRALVEDYQLVILRDFSSFDDSQRLSDFCASLGEIMQWPFGSVLDLVEQPEATDHIFANSYVPLHWDGMYLNTVPEIQVFQAVSAINAGQGGRTTFASTTTALDITAADIKANWQQSVGQYQRSVALYGSTAKAPIIDRHPYRHYPVIRFVNRLSKAIQPFSILPATNLPSLRTKGSHNYCKALSRHCMTRECITLINGRLVMSFYQTISRCYMADKPTLAVVADI